MTTNRHQSSGVSRDQKLLGIDRAQLESLISSLEFALASEGCDSTLRHSMTWARENGIDQKRLTVGLEHFGGYCDDEVVYNVDPERIF